MRTQPQITRPLIKCLMYSILICRDFDLLYGYSFLGMYSYSLFKIAQESQKDKEAQEAVKIAVTQ